MAVPALQALVAAGHEVSLVISAPDRRRGRGPTTTPSPVKAAAVALGVATTEKASEVLELDPPIELGVVVAYGQLIRPPVLALAPMINLHFSLLPRWRGAAPVERAILAGDQKTGVCVMALEEGLDTGPIYARAELEIGATEHLGSLRHRLVDLGVALLLEVLANGVDGLVTPAPQIGAPTYAKKLDPTELEIDWSRPSIEVLRLIRLDRAYTRVEGKRLGVLAASLVSPPNPWNGPRHAGTLMGDMVITGDEVVRLEQVQPEGRRAMSAQEWCRGSRLPRLVRLGGDGE